MSEEPEIVRGSGNVFADLGLPDPEGHLLKAGIVVNIQKIIRERELSEGSAAARMGLETAELKRMLVGHFTEYSVDDLLKMVNALGSDVQIVITTKETTGDKATLSVVAA
jgi:predicted XRE-type DNA-binding protein